MSYPKAREIVPYLQSRLGAPYVYGAIGQVMTPALIASLAKAFPAVYTDAYIKKALKFVGRQAFDCTGLIKFFAPWEQDLSRNYKAGQDISADGAYRLAAVRGAVSALPEMPGLCVHMPGHIGVYVGGGEVIEARGINYGVVKTKLCDRPWQHWLQFPFLGYRELTPGENPAWEKEKKSVTQKDFDAMMENWLARRAALPSSAWDSSGELEAARAAGITDGTNPQSFATREQAALMALRARGKK